MFFVSFILLGVTVLVQLTFIFFTYWRYCQKFWYKVLKKKYINAKEGWKIGYTGQEIRKLLIILTSQSLFRVQVLIKFLPSYSSHFENAETFNKSALQLQKTSNLHKGLRLNISKVIVLEVSSLYYAKDSTLYYIRRYLVLCWESSYIIRYW